MPDPVTVTIDGRTLVLTHLDKELFADGWTKHDLIEYYANAAPYMLPHLQGRPATLIRLPGGAGSEPFFAKTPPPGLPEWVPTVPVLGRDGPKDHVSVDARPTLIALANADAVEIHVPQWRHPHPDLHDRLVIDLDPGPGRTIIDCALVARGVQVILESDGIACWPKTSGSKGLHILAAIAPTPGAEVAAYAKSLAQSLESIWPHLVVHKMARGLREGRVLVDWSQNSHNKTTCAPYSVRCGDAPGVSTPLTWNEVEAASEPRDLVFAPAELLDRVEKHGDLIAGLLDPAVTTTVHS